MNEHLKDILTGLWFLGTATIILIGLPVLIIKYPIFLIPTILVITWGIGRIVRMI